MIQKTPLYILLLTLLTVANVGFAQSPAPPTGVFATDTPDDAGQSVDIEWALSTNDIFNSLDADTEAPDPELIVASYNIERKTITAKSDGEI
ncbi:MAG: hypothetical protein QF732_12585, partial [Nitrospinaceae bacterium]|nr:hypothetical protein [Nitrospinaceae bacterium]